MKISPLSRPPESTGAAEISSRGIHVVERGGDAADAPVALLFHFTGAHSRQMAPLAEGLARHGIHAVAVDLPGHGHSSGPAGQFDTESLLETLAEVCSRYDRGHGVGVVGSSWGGDLALLLALWEAERRRNGRRPVVSAVVAQALIAPWLVDGLVRIHPGLALLRGPGAIGPRLLDWALGGKLRLRQMFRLSDVYASPWRRRQFADDPLRLRGYHAASYLRYLTYRPSADPSELEIPVMILAGGRDRLTPVALQRAIFHKLRSTNRATAFAVVPNGSHALFEEQVEESARLTASWLWQSQMRNRAANGDAR